MNPWLVLPALVLLALLYVLLPVGVAMAYHFRRPKHVRCPLAGEGASVAIGRAGLAEALGRRSLRRVERCTLWPRRQGCRQDCLRLPETALRDVRTVV